MKKNPLASPVGIVTRQRGISLLVSLLVLVLISLAAAAMMRSLDGNTLAVGNLAFRQAAEAPISQAIETAMGHIQGTDKTWMEHNDGAKNYYAFIQPGEDADGIPADLQDSSFSSLSFWSDGAENKVRYVVERMCREEGEWRPEKCLKQVPPVDLSEAGSSSDENNNSEGMETPVAGLFRITVRVDGPARTRVFAQTFVASGV